MLRERVAGAAAGPGTEALTAGDGAADLARRAAGAATPLKRRNASDEAVAAAVRRAIRRRVSAPTTIGVVAHDGRVFLHGEVSPQEHGPIVQAAHLVEGVDAVTDYLIVREAGIGAGSGEAHPERSGFKLMQENWPTRRRVLSGAIGSVLLANGLRRRGALGIAVAAIGGSLLLRSATSRPFKRLGGSQGVIDLHRTLIVGVPVDQLFRLLASYEHYPAFMPNVREVKRYEDGRSHWVVAGPAGSSLEWDSVTTVFRPNEILGWRSVPGSRIEHSGMMRFEPVGVDQTRLDIDMSYSPQAGALGHWIARVFGVDPDTGLDQALPRGKGLLETVRRFAQSKAAPDLHST
jgi:uncharacterized membrane protein